jgi:hypothetical protein
MPGKSDWEPPNRGVRHRNTNWGLILRHEPVSGDPKTSSDETGSTVGSTRFGCRRRGERSRLSRSAGRRRGSPTTVATSRRLSSVSARSAAARAARRCRRIWATRDRERVGRRGLLEEARVASASRSTPQGPGRSRDLAAQPAHLGGAALVEVDERQVERGVGGVLRQLLFEEALVARREQVAGPLELALAERCPALEVDASAAPTTARRRLERLLGLASTRSASS